jgi:uncharacterized membrane protein YeaQ/YmgE (transglycosylase-associated protein family)
MHIGIDTLAVFLGVGLVVGLLAGVITQGRGFGIIGNIIVGVIGAFIGFYLMRSLHMTLAPGLPGTIITATLGAVILLFFIGLLRR